MEEYMPSKQVGGELENGEGRKSSEKYETQQPREELRRVGSSSMTFGRRHMPIAQGLVYRHLMHCGTITQICHW